MDKIHFEYSPKLKEYYEYIVHTKKWLKPQDVPLEDVPQVPPIEDESSNTNPFSPPPTKPTTKPILHPSSSSNPSSSNPSSSNPSSSTTTTSSTSLSTPPSKMLSLTSIQSLHAALTAHSASLPPALPLIPLHVLLRGAPFLPRPLPPKPVDPAVRATVQRLRAEASNREYARMVSTMGSALRQQAIVDRGELKGAGHVLGIGANILLTMATMFTLGYFLLAYGMGSKVWGIAGGLCFMVVGLVVEGSLFVLGGYQLDSHREKEEERHRRSLGRSKAFPVEPLVKSGPRSYLRDEGPSTKIVSTYSPRSGEQQVAPSSKESKKNR